MKYYIVIFIFFNSSISLGQIDSSNIINIDSCLLHSDTLYIYSQPKVFVGQKIIVGKGSDENGWYKSISFKNAYSFPLLFLRKTEIQQNVDYQLDPSKRDKDKVKEYLTEGTKLTITKIKLVGRIRKWHTYIVFLKTDGPFAIYYKCYIIDAIQMGELLVV